MGVKKEKLREKNLRPPHANYRLRCRRENTEEKHGETSEGGKNIGKRKVLSEEKENKNTGKYIMENRLR